MKMKRVISGAILFAVTVAILISGITTVVNITIAIVALIAINEYFNSIKNRNKIERIFADILAISIAFLDIIPTHFLILIYPITITVLFIEVIITEMKTSYQDITKTGFGIIYIIGFLMFIPLIYKLDNGKLLIWYIAIAAWGTDTFAYWIGCKFGKHKFTKISPKKSYEGLIAGALGAMIFGYIFSSIFLPDLKEILLVTSPFLAIIEQFSDIIESALKRKFNVKDSGHIIPGHGGLLDRFDGFLLTVPAVIIIVELYLHLN